MAKSHTPSINAVQTSVIDGRMQNVQYRQRILHQLHDTLVDNVSAICNAVQVDSGNSEAEAEVEFYCALYHLKSLFDGHKLDFRRGLQEEYSLEKGIDFPTRSVAVGLILITPTVYSRFYSTISPLSAAVAAGNCVLLELSNSLQTQETDDLLRQLLPKALNLQAAIFTFTPYGYKAEQGTKIIKVQQDNSSNDSTANSVRHISLTSANSENKAIAIVDRTANLDEAAHAILTGRFNFQGKSLYALDYILVNEFVKKNFLNACIRHSISKAENPTVDGHMHRNLKSQHAGDAPRQKLINAARLNGDTILLEGASSTIIDVQQRESELLARKIRFPVLIVHSFSSLEDVLHCASKMQSPLLASYIFASLPVAKYLSQFLESHVSCINQIPINLLVGPVAPQGFAVSLTQRYRPEMFSVPSPQYVVQPENEQVLNAALETSIAHQRAPRLRSLAVAPLAPIKQPEKNEVMGYFETAILTGFGTIVVPALTAAGFLAYHGFLYASKHLSRWFPQS